MRNKRCTMYHRVLKRWSSCGSPVCPMHVSMLSPLWLYRLHVYVYWMYHIVELVLFFIVVASHVCWLDVYFTVYEFLFLYPIYTTQLHCICSTFLSTEVVGISAKLGTGVPWLLYTVLQHVHPGPMYYPRDYVADRNERFFATEIVRECLLELYHVSSYSVLCCLFGCGVFLCWACEVYFVRIVCVRAVWYIVWGSA